MKAYRNANKRHTPNGGSFVVLQYANIRPAAAIAALAF